LFCDKILLLISNAASNEAALAFPIPSFLIKCEGGLEAKTARLSFSEISSPSLPILLRQKIRVT
jgi:hypothetical protein